MGNVELFADSVSRLYGKCLYTRPDISLLNYTIYSWSAFLQELTMDSNEIGTSLERSIMNNYIEH